MSRSGGVGIMSLSSDMVITRSSKAYCKLWTKAPHKIRPTPSKALELEDSSSGSLLPDNMAVSPTNTMDTTFQKIPIHMKVLSLCPSTNCFRIATKTIAEPRSI